VVIVPDVLSCRYWSSVILFTVPNEKRKTIMRNKTLYSLFALVLLAGMVFSLVQPASAMVKPAAQGLDKVEPAVLNTISAKGASDYVVEMAEKADLSAAYEIED